MMVIMSEEKPIVMDQEKANTRNVAGCEVQTIPKRWTKRPKVVKMLAEAYMFLTVKDGTLVIEIRRPREGETIQPE